MTDGESEPTTPFVESFARGLAVLTAFNSGERALSVSQVAARTGLSRAATRRLLFTLVELEYASTNGNVFALRAKALELGSGVLKLMSFPDVARPPLDRFAQMTGYPASGAFLDRANAVFVVSVPGSRTAAPPTYVGSSLPAFATPAGRVLLAAISQEERGSYLPASAGDVPADTITGSGGTVASTSLDEIRERGYLFESDAKSMVRAAAAPIRDVDGVVMASVQFSVLAHEGSDDVEWVLATFLKTAREIEAGITWSSHDQIAPGLY